MATRMLIMSRCMDDLEDALAAGESWVDVARNAGVAGQGLCGCDLSVYNALRGRWLAVVHALYDAGHIRAGQVWRSAYAEFRDATVTGIDSGEWPASARRRVQFTAHCRDANETRTFDWPADGFLRLFTPPDLLGAKP